MTPGAFWDHTEPGLYPLKEASPPHHSNSLLGPDILLAVQATWLSVYLLVCSFVWADACILRGTEKGPWPCPSPPPHSPFQLPCAEAAHRHCWPHALLPLPFSPLSSTRTIGLVAVTLPWRLGKERCNRGQVASCSGMQRR